MNKRLNTLLQDLALRDWGDENHDVLAQSEIRYLARKVYNDYEPSQFDRFEGRLDRWLHNVTDEKDQRTLFLLLSHLFFVGRSEFESLCRAAYNGPICRWLVDQLNVDITNPAATKIVQRGTANTWFCPISDSMRIDTFLKVNNITGESHRPDWRSLLQFGEPDKIRRFVADKRICRLVLLEDFVGSGTQMRAAIEFAAKALTDVAILAIPLVICPDGERVGHDLARRHTSVSYDAVLRIPPTMFIKATPQHDEPPLFQVVRDLIARVGTRLRKPPRAKGKHGNHGYKGTGAVVAMYSNCPNNTLPIIHDETTEWFPLFPRIRRR